MFDFAGEQQVVLLVFEIVLKPGELAGVEEPYAVVRGVGVFEFHHGGGFWRGLAHRGQLLSDDRVDERAFAAFAFAHDDDFERLAAQHLAENIQLFAQVHVVERPRDAVERIGETLHVGVELACFGREPARNFLSGRQDVGCLAVEFAEAFPDVEPEADAPARAAFEAGLAEGPFDVVDERPRLFVDPFLLPPDAGERFQHGVHECGGNLLGVGLVRHVTGDVGGIGRRVQERVVELGLQFGMEGAFPENSLRRLLHKLVLPVGEHVVRRGDRREQQQDAVVEGVAGDRLDGLGEHGQHGG